MTEWLVTLGGEKPTSEEKVAADKSKCRRGVRQLL